METTRGILLIYNALDSPEIKKCFFPFKSNFSIKFTKIILPLYYSNILKLTLNYTKEILKFSTNNLKSCSINNQLLQLQHLFFSIFSSLSSSNISLHINRNHNIPPYIILIFIPSLSQHLKTIKKKKKNIGFSNNQQNFPSTSSSSNNFPRINHPRPTSKPTSPPRKTKISSKPNPREARQPSLAFPVFHLVAWRGRIIWFSRTRPVPGGGSSSWRIRRSAGSARCARYSASTLQDSIF